MQPAILCLTGPTAAGKSATTLALAQRWPIEIIVMDSATIYRHMDIGTAKPSAEEQAQVPHHLLDIRDPVESYSAAEFVSDTEQCIQAIHQRGNHVLLCGGTLMYYKSLREGLNPLPPSNPTVRAELDAQAARLGWPALHTQLAKVDAQTAARLAPNDSQRIQRALEIYQSSGRSLSDWLATTTPQSQTNYTYHTLSLEPSDRAVLHQRIATRYQQMLKDGLVEEVAALHARKDLHLGLPSMRCVGYRQIWEHLDGEYKLETAIERAIAATRQLAKRQITWLRSDPNRHIVDCLASDKTAQVIDLVGQWWA